jgi:hypothetical protein
MSSNERRAWEAVVVAGGMVAVLGFVWAMLAGNYDQYAAVIIAMVLLAVTVPLARHAARVEAWPSLTWLLMGTVVLKLGGALARYAVAYGVYGGVADASTYTSVAMNNYRAFRHLHLFMPNTGVRHGLVPFIDTIVYAIAGPTELGVFLVFSWISFVGTYLFYRAFRIAYPDGDGRRYLVLVFFLPSLLYWPSSLGKEGWMVFALGLASYGLARALAGRVGGYAALVAGVAAMVLVRPHLALIFLPAAIIAFLLRRTTPGRRRPIGRLVGIGVLVLSSLLVVGKAQSYFGINNLDVQSVTQQLTTTRDQTAIGNSAFNPPNSRSPIGYPEAVVTVLFRPFPFEAHSVTVLISSGEGLVLLMVTIGSWRRLRRLPSALWRNPYVVFALVYSALFVLAFANFANFGILARERVQMFPMFLVLLAIPAGEAGPRPRRPKAGRVKPAETAKGAEEPLAAPALLSARRRRVAPTLAGPLRMPAPAPPSRPEHGRRLGPYRALAYGFDVVAEPGTPVEYLETALAALAEPTPASVDHHYRLRRTEGREGLLLALDLDDGPLGGPTAAHAAVVALMASVNRAAVASRPHHLAVHAGAVSLEGHGLLLPGPPGAGKTTLTAGLVAAGFDYLSDEAAVIDPVTLRIGPYPKPLSLSAESSEVLGPMLVRAGNESALPQAPLVPVDAFRAEAVGRPVAARFLVFPRYQEGALSALTALSRAEAMVELAGNSFNFVDHGGDWLELLAQVVRDCRCLRITVGDLGAACALLVRLVRFGELEWADEH